MMFWIYQNGNSKATLPRGGCVDSNFGTRKKDRIDLSGKWDGPFELLEDAKPKERIKLIPCRKCRPEEDWSSLFSL